MASSARGDSFPSSDGRGKGIASSHFIAATGHTGSGTPRYTSPDPVRTAARPAKTAAPEKPTGKQTVKQLIGQNQGVSNIEITDSNIKSFERVARKYGVDFAVKKDRSVSPPKYLIFFKGRDADALTAAFKEYTAKEVRRASKDKSSVLEQLRALKAKVLSLTPDKSRNKDKGLEL